MCNRIENMKCEILVNVWNINIFTEQGSDEKHEAEFFVQPWSKIHKKKNLIFFHYLLVNY